MGKQQLVINLESIDFAQIKFRESVPDGVDVYGIKLEDGFEKSHFLFKIPRSERMLIHLFIDLCMERTGAISFSDRKRGVTKAQ